MKVQPLTTPHIVRYEPLPDGKGRTFYGLLTYEGYLLPLRELQASAQPMVSKNPTAAQWLIETIAKVERQEGDLPRLAQQLNRGVVRMIKEGLL